MKSKLKMRNKKKKKMLSSQKQLKDNRKAIELI